MLFLNELSFISQAINEQDCQMLMQEIRKVLDNLKPISDKIYTSRNLLNCEIKKDYTVRKYLYDKNIDRVEREYFLIRLSKNPYVDKLLDDKLDYHECKLKKLMKDVTSTSVAGATCFKGLLVSLQRTEDFKDDFISVIYRENDGEFLEKEISNQFDSKKSSIFVKKTIEKKISTFTDMWNMRKELFPSLIFCDEVEIQLKNLNLSVSIRNIIRHLKTMNDYMEKLLNGEITIPNYQEMGIEASIESSTTIKRYGDERKFTCPDGEKRIFTWHSKLKGDNNIRIHFYPPSGEVKDFIIGYIGRKLRTVNSK